MNKLFYKLKYMNFFHISKFIKKLYPKAIIIVIREILYLYYKLNL